jgi:hypothetical protein
MLPIRNGLVIVAVFFASSILNGQEFRDDRDSPESRFEGCAPMSFVHALKLGRDEYRDVFRRLPGTSVAEKCRHVARSFGSLHSRQFPGKPLIDEKGGVSNDDLDDLFNAVLSENGGKQLNSTYLNKIQRESGHDHLTRVHKYIITSLERGMPPVVAFRSMGPKVEKDGKYLSWEAISAHAATIVDVPKELATHQEGFTFDYLEGASADRKQGYLYIEKYREFPVRIRPDSNALYDKPFLNAIVPSMSLGTYKLNWNERGIIIMMVAVGDFETEQ